jgi:RNA polymerase sigma factor (sigma-70 family)
LLDDSDAPDRGPTPEDEAVASGERELLRAALSVLSQEQRVVLQLQLAGWTGQQIAAVLDKSLGAVKMLRYRAVAQLRDTLCDAAVSGSMERDDA